MQGSYAINSIRTLARLAQLVEQWTGNPVEFSDANGIRNDFLLFIQMFAKL